MSHDLQPAFDDKGLSEFRQMVAEHQQQMKEKRERDAELLKIVPVEQITVTCPEKCPLQLLTFYPDERQHCDCHPGKLTFNDSGIGPPPFRRVYDLRPCFDAKPDRQRAENLARLRRQSGLMDGKRNSEYQHTFEQWRVTPTNRDLYDFLRTWNPHADEGIYIASLPSPSNPSGNGLGKSYALHALTNRLCAEGVTCRFCRTSDFLIAIRDTYHSDTEVDELDIVRQFSQVPVLLWDDLGKEAIRSEWGAEKFYQVIDDRCRQGLPVVISSNFLPDMIQDRFGANFGPAIVSRIAAMCPHIFQLAGDDQRFDAR